jgi:hypothetical protein
MNTKADQIAIRTPRRTIVHVYASVIGLYVALLIGAMTMGATFGSLPFRAALKLVVILGVSFGLLSAGLVRLFGLLGGAKPGRTSSYMFTLNLGVLGSWVLMSSTSYYPEPAGGNQAGLIWFMGIVLALIAGAALEMCICDDRRWSRVGTIVGTLVMLLIVICSICAAYNHKMLGNGEALMIQITTFYLAVCGGALGAAIGARGGKRTGEPHHP